MQLTLTKEILLRASDPAKCKLMIAILQGLIKYKEVEDDGEKVDAGRD
jgi:hypothetical protein